MAIARLQVDYTQFLEHIALLKGWDRDPDNWTATRRADAKRCIQSGLRKFYNAHPWSFLQVRADPPITAPAPYNTGTVTIATDAGGSIVTLAGGGTWPSWAADGELEVAGVTYTVASRTNDTALVLESPDAEVTSATSFTLSQFRFALPIDFAALAGPITYNLSDTNRCYPLRSTHESELRRYYMLRTNKSETECPRLYAIYARPHDLTSQQQFILEVAPPPTRLLHLDFMYRSQPAETDTDNPYPVGGEQHGETILEAVLAEAETKLNADSREHAAKYMQSLANSIRIDGQTATPEYQRDFRNPTSDAYYAEEFGGDAYPYNLPGLTIPTGYESFF